MIREGLTLKGLKSSTTVQLTQEENTFVDTMVWESQSAADAANAVFKTLPSAKSFYSMMAGPPRANLVMEYAADNV